MSGLISTLQGVSSAIAAFGQALGVEQSNVSNTATPGYAAMRAMIHPIGVTTGSATDIVTLQSSGDLRADAIVQAATSQASNSQTTASQLDPVNQQFDITGSSGILAAFQQFSTAFANVSVSPNDTSLRASALSTASTLAAAFNSVAGNLDSQRQRLDSSVQSSVGQINDLTREIAQYNAQSAGQPQIDPVTDASRRQALDQLSSLVGITANANSDGTLNVLAAGSIPLVLGSNACTLVANPAAASGSQIQSSGGGVASGSFSGTLGALLDARNQTITSILGDDTTQGSLNVLAQGFADRVNALLSSGTAIGGAQGVPLFTYDMVNPSNVARTLSVDPAVTANQLGLASTGGAAQSNGIANQLAALAASNNPTDQISGASPEDYYATVASSVGRQLSDARSQATADQSYLTSTQAGRQAVSGVSLDQEAVNITAFQRSWQAAARMISILDDLTGEEVNLIK
jgi:flagellar hook-associated protein 1 FlgK